MALSDDDPDIRGPLIEPTDLEHSFGVDHMLVGHALEEGGDLDPVLAGQPHQGLGRGIEGDPQLGLGLQEHRVTAAIRQNEHGRRGVAGR